MPAARKSKEEVLTLIKQLLNMQTAKGASENEAEQAMRHAQRLLDEYALTMDDLNKHQTLDSSIGEQEIITEFTRDKFPQYVAILAQTIVDAFDCQLIFSGKDVPNPNIPNTTRRVRSIKFIGTAIDVDIAAYFFVSLRIRLLMQANIDYDRFHQKHERRETFVHQYITSAAKALESRLRLERSARFHKEPQLNALVQTKQRAIVEFVQRQYPSLGYFRGGRTSGRGSSVGEQLGTHAGKSIHLTRGINGQPTKPRYLK